MTIKLCFGFKSFFFNSFYFVSTIADTGGDKVEVSIYFQQMPCVTTNSHKYLDYWEAHIQIHVQPQQVYKTYWRALSKCGLWKDPLYQAKKVKLGDHVNTVRERMPNCVIKEWGKGFLSILVFLVWGIEGNNKILIQMPASKRAKVPNCLWSIIQCPHSKLKWLLHNLGKDIHHKDK